MPSVEDILAGIVAQVNKTSPGTIIDVEHQLISVDVIPTGSMVVDYVTGIGGIPKGRITELHGEESAGKTTCALQTLANAQEMGGVGVYQDYEFSFDKEYARSLGVDLSPSKFVYVKPDTMESGFRILEALINKVPNKNIAVTIGDSVTAMKTQADVAQEIGEVDVSSQARVMSKSLRQIKQTIDRGEVAFIFINQLREVIDTSFAGQMKARAGKQYTTSGGRAVKFYSDLRLEFMRGSQVKAKEDPVFGEGYGDDKKINVVIGQKARVTCVKNKCGEPWRQGEIYITRGKGIDSTRPCVDLAVDYGLIQESRKLYRVPQPFCSPDKLEETFQGTELVLAYFEKTPEALQKLAEQVFKRLNNK